MFFKDHKIIKCGFDYSVTESLKYTIRAYKNKLQKELEDLKKKLLILETIEKIKKDGNIKGLVSLTLNEAVKHISKKYKVNEDIAKQVLGRPISYLTKEHQEEIETLRKEISVRENDLDDIYGYMIRKYKSLKNKIEKTMNFNYRTTFSK